MSSETTSYCPSTPSSRESRCYIVDVDTQSSGSRVNIRLDVISLTSDSPERLLNSHRQHRLSSWRSPHSPSRMVGSLHLVRFVVTLSSTGLSVPADLHPLPRRSPEKAQYRSSNFSAVPSATMLPRISSAMSASRTPGFSNSRSGCCPVCPPAPHDITPCCHRSRSTSSWDLEGLEVKGGGWSVSQLRERKRRRREGKEKQGKKQSAKGRGGMGL